MSQRKQLLLVLLLPFFLFTHCKKEEQSEQHTPEMETLKTNPVQTGITGLPPLEIPENNPQSTEKIALGQQLFHEKRFSADGTVSCATCHIPENAFVDRRKVSKGIKNLTGTRNAPTVINAAFLKSQFWDGRRDTLEEQAKDPLLNPVEHGLKSHDEVLSVVREDEGYGNQFKMVFNVTGNAITIDHVVQAIAAFERTVISGNSPFDKYKYEGDKTALSPEATRGLAVFTGKGRCQECHMIGETSSIFTDDKFHNLGIGINRYEADLQNIVENFRKMKEMGDNVDTAVLTSETVSELGRYAITLELSDVGAFKTPTLRNIEKTGPYMHDGSLKTLEEVVDHYNKGGNKNPFLSGSILPLDLSTQEKKDLVAFLKALTSPEFKKQ